MRTLLVVPIAIIVACSSSNEPECLVDGTYSVTGVVQSGTCPGSADAIVDTFTTLSDGEVKLQIQSLPDLVPVGKMNGCTWTAAGAVIITDATDPANNKGTLQYSYTFTRSGFTGIVAGSFPPAKSLAAGCQGQTRVTGKRL